MDELVGEQAVWRFDGESIAIRYETKGWSRSPLLKQLGHLELPVGLIGTVDFRPSGGKRGKGWLMQLKLRERTDPYAAVGAMLDDKSQPFHLSGPARTELVAEYLADQIRFAAERHTAEPDPAAATALVPELPLHVQTSEGTATLDGTALRLVWSGVQASSRKKKAQRREYDLADVSSFEWVPSDGWEWGFLRVVTRQNSEPDAKPGKDLRCLLADDGAEGYQALLMAATATAHLWARGPAGGAPGRAGATAGWLGSARTAIAQISAGVPALGERSAERAPADTAWIYEQIERLGELHTKGLLTDEEFATKKAELLARI
ncbi:putative oligomerization/nucleic acid binding protein [Nocardiopsis sp. Huas11]|uniref:DUF4429 domain-containing protein n=1 Tax=Nocardiopsis sp. Huas11 TaxID=2183912 RepID=UPI000EAE4D5C|nr:DUF4429 domain-containing protein [Nocardiopsis sp. Huas11]RKS05484.1 putative oligomerization/nucleic acid binding protein [Nocardiopsis sp. Huas11]